MKKNKKFLKIDNSKSISRTFSGAHIYMEFRKMVMVTLYVRQQERHRCI